VKRKASKQGANVNYGPLLFGRVLPELLCGRSRGSRPSLIPTPTRISSHSGALSGIHFYGLLLFDLDFAACGLRISQVIFGLSANA
jgi:hypothetical protein